MLVPSCLLSGCIEDAGEGRPTSAPAPLAETDDQKIIGGFAANDRKLDGAGALVALYNYPSSIPSPYPPRPQLICGAALVANESIVTAKHCADAIPRAVSNGMTVAFALGPDISRPRRIVEVVGFEMAPGDVGGYVRRGRDVAVLHLDEPLPNEPKIAIGTLSDADIGQPLVAIGYGAQDNARTSGTRKFGRQTLKAREGRTYEALFGTFEAFFEWVKKQLGRPSYTALASDEVGGEAAGGAPADGGVGEADGGIVGDSGAGGAGGAGGVAGAGGRGGAGGARVDGGAGIPDHVIRGEAQRLWNSVVLEKDYEVVTGGVAGDSQPCYGDSGSPLLRKQDGKFVTYGVVSGGTYSDELICDRGTIYATFGPETLAFVNKAVAWTDPCADLGTRGVCEGDVLKRCTGIAEGRRRVVEFDCSLLNLPCNPTGPQVTCGEAPPISGQPPVRPLTPADLRNEVDHVFGLGPLAR